MPLTATQSEVVQSAAAFSSVLSGVGNIALLLHSSGWRAAPVHSPSRFVHRTLFFLSATNLGQCIGFALGNLPVSAGGSAGCVAQALLLQFSGLSTVLWTLVLAHGLWRSSCKGDGAQALARHERPASYLAFGLPVLSCVALWVQGDLGEEEDSVVQDQWCWIGVAGGSSATDGALRFVSLYMWVTLGWLWAIFVFHETTKALQARTDAVSLVQRERAAEMARGAIKQLRMLVGIFIAVWLGGLIARLYEVGVGEESFALTFWQCATLPLAGLLNACSILLPHKLRERTRAARGGGGASGGLSGSLLGGDSLTHTDDAVSLPLEAVDDSGGATGAQLPIRPSLSPLTVSVGGAEASGDVSMGGSQHSLSVITWNLGEGKLSDPAQLGPLLLPAPGGADAAADVYLISLQECVDVDAWVSLALACLQAETGGAYSCCVEKIGSAQTWLGYHGYISIILLASPSLVASGEFSVLGLGRQLKTGKTLPGGLGHLSNKGGVGLSFRLGGTSFAAVGCHLPSDSSGDKEGNMKSKLTKRNEQVRSMMNSLELNNLSGVEDVDCCDLFHHTFFLGDLNYRLDDSSNLDQTVAGLARAMSTKAAAAPAAAGGQIAEDEAAAWSVLLRSDELNVERAAGTVFDGWREGAIAFPPSYRRRRVLPSAGAFASEDTLRAECYSINTGAPGDKAKTRKPGWCDRVLSHSLDGLEGQLQQLSYTTVEGSECEAVTVSDHVPVVSRMVVHAAPHLVALTPTGGGSGGRQVQLVLQDLSIQLLDSPAGAGGNNAAAAAGGGSGGSSNGTIRLSTVVYPLPSEDELAPLRSAASLISHFSSPTPTAPGGGGGGGSTPGASESGGSFASLASSSVDVAVTGAAAAPAAAAWESLCSPEGGVVLQCDVDDAGAWRQTHALLKLEEGGGVIGQFVISLAAVAEAMGAAGGGGALSLSLPVRRHSVKVATVSGSAKLMELA